MLLHVVESTGPVYLANHPLARQRLRQKMGYAVAFVDHIRELDPAQPAGIVRLAA
jgi:hypothetical protein